MSGPIVGVLGGGKRLRPALTVAAAGAPARRRPDAAVVAAAASVELLHWATLAHDDVIDDAQSRHGQPTLNAAHGLAPSIVAGDLLIGTAFDLGADSGPTTVRLLATALTELCVGQAREDTHRYDPGTDEDDVLCVVSGKTGTLLATAAQLGGVVADRPASAVHALREFGLAFGISLQLLDDVLDLVSSQSLLGKPVLADFAAGTITLPAVAAMRRHPSLRELLRPDLTDAERERAVDLLRDPETLRYALDRAGHHADRARAILGTHLETSTDPTTDQGDRAALARLARWPRSYLRHQLTTKVEARWQSVLEPVGCVHDGAYLDRSVAV